MMGRRMILITCVIVLCFAGVGYSAWTEGLSIKSLFATGNIHVDFEDPVIVNNELYEITVDASEGFLDICGTVAPGSIILVEYDIYNGSSIPVKYYPDDEDFPEGVALDQDDTVIKPGAYLRGNQLTIEPGKNELTLPFVQYNSRDNGGWKEELKICWNITVIEEIVDPELDMVNGITEDGPIEDVPAGDEPTENVPEVEPLEDVTEIKSPTPETTPGVDPEPAADPNMNEATIQSEPPAETNDDNLVEVNTESDEGSEENVNDGEE